MNITSVGVNTPDSGIPLAVDGMLFLADGEAVGVADGLAVNDGRLELAAATTKLRFTVCSIPSLSVKLMVIV